MIIDTSAISGRERYQLLTSLVVPRPIAWVSTWSGEDRANLAPFSYFAALSSSPLLIGVSIGHRRGAPKDTLRNVRERGGFCVNLVTERQLRAMNETSGEWGPEMDEFERAGLPRAAADSVDAPYVASAPATLECRVFREVELGDAPNTLVIGEVLRIRLANDVELIPGSCFVDSVPLHPVGRLWGELYALLGQTPALPRPPT